MRNNHSLAKCHFPLLRLFANRCLLIGITVGIILGLFVNLASDLFVDKSKENVKFFSQLPEKFIKSEQPDNPSSFLIRCVIILQEADGLLAEKNFSAVKDTWTKECNQTIFLTESPLLQSRFSDEMILIVINFNGKFVDWTLFNQIIQFLSKMEVIGEKWTIITNGQSYLHIANLRSILSNVRDDVAVILGRKVQYSSGFWHTIWSRIFSSNQENVHFALSSNGPLIFSRKALRILADHCQDREKSDKWFMRFFEEAEAGLKITECALKLGIALWDPMDDDFRPMIVTDNFRMEISRKANNATKMPSDRAIAFTVLSSSEQRLLDYCTRRLNVFGIGTRKRH